MLCPRTRAPMVSSPRYATARSTRAMVCFAPKNAEFTSFKILAVIATSRAIIRAASATVAFGCCRPPKISWKACGGARQQFDTTCQQRQVVVAQHGPQQERLRDRCLQRGALARLGEILVGRSDGAHGGSRIRIPG